MKMARPTKSAKLLHECSQTKEEIRKRIDTEEKLKGKSDKIKPSSYLTKKQRAIFKNIVTELENAGILGNLDVYLLNQMSITIDRLQELEMLINKDIKLSFNPDIIRARNAYSRDFQRLCNELSLSPQSRAKFGNINLQKEQEQGDPLLKLLKGAG